MSDVIRRALMSFMPYEAPVEVAVPPGSRVYVHGRSPRIRTVNSGITKDETALLTA